MNTSDLAISTLADLCFSHATTLSQVSSRLGPNTFQRPHLLNHWTKSIISQKCYSKCALPNCHKCFGSTEQYIQIFLKLPSFTNLLQMKIHSLVLFWSTKQNDRQTLS